MADQEKSGMQCAEFERVLSEALDEKLEPQSFEGFQAHARACPVCGPMLAEVDAGRRWLKSLDETEPPSHLIENILVATSGLDTSRLGKLGEVRPAGTQVTWVERLRDWTGSVFAPAFAVARQPRFAMSFGMAFFSLSISLSLAGVKLTDLRHMDLRPSAIKRNYFETSGRVVKYYENIRFVYEIESRVREFKQATVPVEPPPEEKPKSRKDNTSEQPDKRQDRNYSQEDGSPVLAATPQNPPVARGNTDRRLS
ncbi:MAG: anti-sigma factor family protein [Terriglobales bacterium]